MSDFEEKPYFKETQKYEKFMHKHRDILIQYAPGKKVFEYIRHNYVPEFMTKEEFENTFLKLRKKMIKNYNRCYYCCMNAQFCLGSLGICQICKGEIPSCSNKLCNKCSIKLNACYNCGTELKLIEVNDKGLYDDDQQYNSEICDNYDDHHHGMQETQDSGIPWKFFFGVILVGFFGYTFYSQ